MIEGVAYALRRFYEARTPPTANPQRVKSHAADQPHGPRDASDGQYKTFTPFELRSNPEAAHEAANEAPVIITKAGKPAYVLVTVEEYQRHVQKPKQ